MLITINDTFKSMVNRVNLYFQNTQWLLNSVGNNPSLLANSLNNNADDERVNQIKILYYQNEFEKRKRNFLFVSKTINTITFVNYLFIPVLVVFFLFFKIPEGFLTDKTVGLVSLVCFIFILFVLLINQYFDEYDKQFELKKSLLEYQLDFISKVNEMSIKNDGEQGI